MRNIILITIAGFTLSYARYGKLRNGYDVMQLHTRILNLSSILINALIAGYRFVLKNFKTELFSQIHGYISRTTEPILGLFVLILMHNSP